MYRFSSEKRDRARANAPPRKRSNGNEDEEEKKFKKIQRFRICGQTNTLKAIKESEGSHRIEGAHAAKTPSRVNEDDGSVISPGVLYVYISSIYSLYLNIQKLKNALSTPPKKETERREE